MIQLHWDERLYFSLIYIDILQRKKGMVSEDEG
jgi:hypothetical protein